MVQHPEDWMHAMVEKGAYDVECGHQLGLLQGHGWGCDKVHEFFHLFVWPRGYATANN